MNEQNISKVIGTTVGLFPNEIAFLLTKNALCPCVLFLQEVCNLELLKIEK